VLFRSFLGSGGRRAGTQSLFEFGETSTNRSLISPRGLQRIVESVQSIDEMKSVFIHQLTTEGGIIDRLRLDHEDTSIVNRETIVMNQAVRDITANIAARLPQECAALLEKALLEVYDILAPRICTYFNLTAKSDVDIQVSVAFAKLRKKWATLNPLYEDLDRVKHEISDNRTQMEGAVAQLRILEKTELEQQRDNHDDEWEFMDSSWTPAQLSQASKGKIRLDGLKSWVLQKK
jgi:hypothetical protein